MVLISYDISNNKKRNGFNKYIKKFGHKIQYSVYQIDNSERVLNNILESIKNKFSKKFDEKDSIMIFKMNERCEIIKYGYIEHEDKPLYIV